MILPLQITCDNCGNNLSVRHDAYPVQWRLSVRAELIPTTSSYSFACIPEPKPKELDFCDSHCLAEYFEKQS